MVITSGVLFVQERLSNMLKRSFDVLASGFGIVVTAPLLLLVAVVIKLDSRGPVFYRGQRVGRCGSLFRIFKFRTMCIDAEKIGGSSTSDADPRITRVGHFLRKFKLDEFPQLFNVLNGTMSFVGPRPQVASLVELYTADQRRLLDVRPGITDYASLKFRNQGQILAAYDDADKAYLERVAPEKIRLGLYYVEINSIWIDLSIIVATMVSVFLRIDVLAIPSLPDETAEEEGDEVLDVDNSQSAA